MDPRGNPTAAPVVTPCLDSPGCGWSRRGGTRGHTAACRHRSQATFWENHPGPAAPGLASRDDTWAEHVRSYKACCGCALDAAWPRWPGPPRKDLRENWAGRYGQNGASAHDRAPEWIARRRQADDRPGHRETSRRPLHPRPPPARCRRRLCRTRRCRTLAVLRAGALGRLRRLANLAGVQGRRNRSRR